MLYSNTTLDKFALFSDETEEYRRPSEPNEGDAVTLRFRTGRDNADKVSFIQEHSGEIEMDKVESDSLFDYYEIKIEIKTEVVYYYFQIIKENETYCYNRLGPTNDIQSCYCFRITPGFHTPDWAKGAVMYQIFVDRFCDSDESNNPLENEYIYIGSPIHQVKDWSQYPTSMDVGCFYGGDLKGVWEKLDYIQSLGVDVIYFNPLFVSPSNHKYDIQDYDYIDPHYGVIVEDGGELIKEQVLDNSKADRYITRTTNKKNLEASNQLFIQLVEEIHKRGMRVILDGVFNHCGSFNKWLDRECLYEGQEGYEKGAYVSEDSPYSTFFKFNQDTWPYNKSYDGWWGHDTLPKLNYEESPKLYEYILKIAEKWVSPPFNVDGWRLDVAADLGHSSWYNHKFWRDFRAVVKKANPDALILAEHYGDPSSWLEGDQWDTVMNYDAFMEPITWFLTGMEKHSDEYNASLYGDGEAFFRSISYHMSRMQTPSLQVAMNELSNHDHSRFLTRTNRVVGRLDSMGSEAASQGVNLGVFRAGVLVLMTWPGAPTLYYGDEAGLCGWTDPDNRRTYPWGKEDLELIEFHRYIISMHKKNIALRKGSLKPLIAGQHLIAYGRFYKSNKCVVVVNNGAIERDVKVPVWEIGLNDGDILIRIMVTTMERYNIGQVDYLVEDGRLNILLEPYSSVLLVKKEV